MEKLDCRIIFFILRNPQIQLRHTLWQKLGVALLFKKMQRNFALNHFRGENENSIIFASCAINGHSFGQYIRCLRINKKYQ